MLMLARRSWKAQRLNVGWLSEEEKPRVAWRAGWLLCLGSDAWPAALFDCLMQRDNDNNASSQIPRRPGAHHSPCYKKKKKFLFCFFCIWFYDKMVSDSGPLAIVHFPLHHNQDKTQRRPTYTVHGNVNESMQHAVICYMCTLVLIHLCLLAPGRVWGSH